MDERTQIWGILLAAGRGARFGREKHAVEFDGSPMWQRSRDALIEGGVERIVIVGDFEGAVPGGDRRRDSVAAGLAAIPDSEGLVLIHDAARPLVTGDLVRRVIERLRVGDVAGVIPAVPVRDTVKRVTDGLVVETVDRTCLVAVQTPQGFNLEVLRSAHSASDVDSTDDASMVEGIGGLVAVVEGDARNLKVTYPGDLALAEALRSKDHG